MRELQRLGHGLHAQTAEEPELHDLGGPRIVLVEQGQRLLEPLQAFVGLERVGRRRLISRHGRLLSLGRSAASRMIDEHATNHLGGQAEEL